MLTWQRGAGQWVTISGHGRFATEAAVRSMAATVVDEAQPVPLQVHLAPAGWRLAAFKDGRILALSDTASGAELSVNLVDRPAPDLAHTVTGARQIGTVRVGGRSGDLVQTTDGWFLQVPLPDGSAFQLQAPALLAREQVIAIGAQVTVTPR